MEMISMYLEQTPSLVTTMKQSYEDKNWQLLQSVIHKMIPSFSIMGINSDFEIIAKKVKDYANLQTEKDEIQLFVNQLEIICLQACDELKDEYNLLKKDNL
jgi:agmatine/peptidylarginine deiminase